MSGSDDYIFVQVKFHANSVSGKAVKVSSLTLDSGEVWVPRSCLHAADDRKLDSMVEGTETELRIRQWAASDKGLI